MLTVVAAFATGFLLGGAVVACLLSPVDFIDVPSPEYSGRGRATAPNAPPIPTSKHRPTSEPPAEPHRTVTLRIVGAQQGQPSRIVEGEDY